MKILNLFCGIGGNRELWGDEHQITAVEYNSKIAQAYNEKFPNDMVIITDAWQYCLEHFHEFDIIWASPPCITHSRLVCSNVGRKYNYNCDIDLKYPDLRLYSLIIFLSKNFRGNWIVENVIPYYDPLIKPTCIRGRHYYWSNIPIPSRSQKSMTKDFRVDPGIRHNGIKNKAMMRNTLLANKVNPLEGKVLLDYLLNMPQKQIEVFLQ